VLFFLQSLHHEEECSTSIQNSRRAQEDSWTNRSSRSAQHFADLRDFLNVRNRGLWKRRVAVCTGLSQAAHGRMNLPTDRGCSDLRLLQKEISTSCYLSFSLSYLGNLQVFLHQNVWRTLRWIRTSFFRYCLFYPRSWENWTIRDEISPGGHCLKPAKNSRPKPKKAAPTKIDLPSLPRKSCRPIGKTLRSRPVRGLSAATRIEFSELNSPVEDSHLLRFATLWTWAVLARLRISSDSGKHLAFLTNRAHNRRHWGLWGLALKIRWGDCVDAPRNNPNTSQKTWAMDEKSDRAGRARVSRIVRIRLP